MVIGCLLRVNNCKFGVNTSILRIQECFEFAKAKFMFIPDLALTHLPRGGRLDFLQPPLSFRRGRER